MNKENMVKYHIVYYENPEDTFSRGVTIEAETMLKALEVFSKNYGYPVEVAYRTRG